MTKCLCLKNDGKRCTRNITAKSGQDAQFCWQHQKCQNIATITSQETKKTLKKKPSLPVPTGPKKTVKKKDIPASSITKKSQKLKSTPEKKEQQQQKLNVGKKTKLYRPRYEGGYGPQFIFENDNIQYNDVIDFDRARLQYSGIPKLLVKHFGEKDKNKDTFDDVYVTDIENFIAELLNLDYVNVATVIKSFDSDNAYKKFIIRFYNPNKAEKRVSTFEKHGAKTDYRFLSTVLGEYGPVTIFKNNHIRPNDLIYSDRIIEQNPKGRKLFKKNFGKEWTSQAFEDVYVTDIENFLAELQNLDHVKIAEVIKAVNVGTGHNYYIIKFDNSKK